MELSSRDKRILAEIECGSALEDPRWVRRYERLGALRRAHKTWHLLLGGLLLLGWLAALVLGATIAPRPLLGSAIGVGVVGCVGLAVLWRRRGPWRRSRRIPRIPRQQGRQADGGGV